MRSPSVPGHWEGDLIGGSRNSYVATLVERHSRYVMLVKIANKDTESVVSALIKQSRKLPGWVFRLHNDDRRVWLDSLTTDVPVPITFVAGAKAREFEVAVGNSNVVSEMMSTARRMLPERIVVSELADARVAA
jgi:hypothetical protein